MPQTILSDIATFLVNILELSQSLDDIDALAGPSNNQLRAFVKTIVQDLEGLENVSPVLSFVVQALVDHVHNLVEFSRAVEFMSVRGEIAVRQRQNVVDVRVIGHLSNFTHLGTSWTPWVVAGRC